MSRVAYVNGTFVPQSRAAISIQDRGFTFADAVYEVFLVVGGRLIDAAWHWDRLERSLGELDIAMPKPREAMELIARRMLALNRVRDGSLYLQVSRGQEARNHVYSQGLSPSVVMTAKAGKPKVDLSGGISVRLEPDIRWRRPDIKTVGLLPNSMAKTRALADGFGDTWFVDDQGQVTEGTSANAWIVIDKDGKKWLQTRDASRSILNGITRMRVLELANANGWQLVEKPFSVEEAKAADEAFLTSSTALIKPVGQIDDTQIADGKVGPVTIAIGQLYRDFLAQVSV